MLSVTGHMTSGIQVIHTGCINVKKSHIRKCKHQMTESCNNILTIKEVLPMYVDEGFSFSFDQCRVLTRF